MPKLMNFKLQIETGEPGMAGPVLFTINNHKLPLENIQGTTDPGGVFEGGFDVNSFAHSLTLVGPEKGQWHIRKIKVDYECGDSAPYTVTFGEVTLDETTEVNIWKDPPLPTFDV
ncbi:MAG: helicase [Nitrospinae bacterium CG11_big_fil_rev_8_21_14_0_20_56_8]|nr:MAG: helicase [Nitrospinae bacterium CG11_big_fil_rev_8_21_14_0_20_56_8]